MSDGSMIERVARAIRCEAVRALGVEPLDTELTPNERKNLLPIARAAIEAMREPTEGMTKAGINTFAYAEVSHAKRIWQTMIDEALKEETP